MGATLLPKGAFSCTTHTERWQMSTKYQSKSSRTQMQTLSVKGPLVLKQNDGNAFYRKSLGLPVVDS